MSVENASFGQRIIITIFYTHDTQGLDHKSVNHPGITGLLLYF